MHLWKHMLALVLIAFAFAVPAQAAPRGVSTGLHASDVEPILRGIAAVSAQLGAYWGCVLALDDAETCVKIADDARRAIGG
jgi:hypothetical protein